jgi:hypothetical protein
MFLLQRLQAGRRDRRPPGEGPPAEQWAAPLAGRRVKEILLRLAPAGLPVSGGGFRTAAAERLTRWDRGARLMRREQVKTSGRVDRLEENQP